MAAEHTPTSVLVVDDHKMVRDGLAAALGLEDDLEVVGAAASVDEAKRRLIERHADVVVTDYRLADGTGLEIAEWLRRNEARTAVLLISGFDRPGLVDDAVRAGCVGFLSKGRDTSDLAEAVRAVATGTAVFPASALRGIVRAHERPGPELTKRELEILRLLAEPRSVEDIADELYISVHTARNHVRSVLSKLRAHSQLEAVVNAVRLGIIDIV